MANKKAIVNLLIYIINYLEVSRITIPWYSAKHLQILKLRKLNTLVSLRRKLSYISEPMPVFELYIKNKVFSAKIVS